MVEYCSKVFALRCRTKLLIRFVYRINNSVGLNNRRLLSFFQAELCYRAIKTILKQLYYTTKLFRNFVKPLAPCFYVARVSC